MKTPNLDVRFTPKADMCGATRDVRFVPIADIRKYLQTPNQKNLSRGSPLAEQGSRQVRPKIVKEHENDGHDPAVHPARDQAVD